MYAFLNCCILLFLHSHDSLITLARVLPRGSVGIMMGVAERVWLSLDRLGGRVVALTIDAYLTDISSECGLHNTSSPSVLGV